jgi:hypothetical protein
MTPATQHIVDQLRKLKRLLREQERVNKAIADARYELAKLRDAKESAHEH